MKNITQEYQNRLMVWNKKLAFHKKRKSNLGVARLISFLAAILLFFILLTLTGWGATIAAVCMLTIFVIVTLKDFANTKELNFVKQIIQINEEEVKALQGDFTAFDGGESFKDEKHPYSGDLDIFGKHSIFQMLNRTTTSRSAEKLAEWLSYPAGKEEIENRQQAIKTLESEVDWRQNLQAVGRHENIRASDFDQILQWAESHPETEQIKKWNILTVLALLMTTVFIVLAAIDILSWQFLWISLIVHSWMIWRYGKIVGPHYELLSKTAPSLNALEKRLYLIESKKFAQPGLAFLQKKLNTGPENVQAHQAIKGVKKVLERLDIRYNPLVHFPLNLVFFWDWHQFRDLSKKQGEIHNKLLIWIDVFVEIEVLSALGNLSYNHPEWCFPEINNQYFTLEAQALGHPLIVSEKRVDNDTVLEGKGKMMLITGSNMAGKSTFLRSVGVNVVLAMAGAPVCAKTMKVSPVNVISSMRIADNLEENISTFYAELQKLEYILKEAKKGGQNLLLMDEILRGTNSNDRHSGSRALIEQLLKVKAVGILATHDLALTDLEEKYPNQVENYHFDVQVQKEVLFFDYALKKGICTSMNASILMRKIGIEV